MSTQKLLVDNSKGFDDPLAAEVGLGVGSVDLPCEGWPDPFNKEIAIKIIRILPEE